MTVYIIAQVMSCVAMGCNALSYQQKKQNILLLYQIMGCSLFSASYFMLGATMGGILNIIAAVRAILFSFPKRLHTSHPLWLVGFGATYVAAYVLSFTVFGTERSPIYFLIEFLPVFAMMMLSLGIASNKPRLVRRFGLLSSPAWLVYNAFYRSIGGMLCEILSLFSIIMGMIRHDKQKGDEPDQTS